MQEKRSHPLEVFRFCPRCGTDGFSVNNEKSKKCGNCGFVYYYNPSAAVAGFISDGKGNLLIARRAKEPAKDTLDLVGGFVDMYETGEQALAREVMEETGLGLYQLRYLFSIPNVYPYGGFVEYTLDMFYEAIAFAPASFAAADDVSELIWIPFTDLDPAAFGLESVRKGVGQYIRLKSLPKGA